TLMDATDTAWKLDEGVGVPSGLLLEAPPGGLVIGLAREDDDVSRAEHGLASLLRRVVLVEAFRSPPAHAQRTRDRSPLAVAATGTMNVTRADTERVRERVRLKGVQLVASLDHTNILAP